MFRNDDGILLEQPYLVDFITSPAPNAGAMKQASGDLAAKLQEVFSERIEAAWPGDPPGV